MLKGAKKKCYKDFADYMPFLISLVPFLPSNCISSGPSATSSLLSGGGGGSCGSGGGDGGDDNTQKFQSYIQMS